MNSYPTHDPHQFPGNHPQHPFPTALYLPNSAVQGSPAGPSPTVPAKSTWKSLLELIQDIFRSRIKMTLVSLGLVVFISVPTLLWETYQRRSNYVLFENSLDVAGELSIDGKTRGTLGPHEHRRFRLAAGEHAIRFKGPAGILDEGSMRVPRREPNSYGYRGLLNLGGRPTIALVTKQYGTTAQENTIEVIPEGERLIATPFGMGSDGVDAAFPSVLRSNSLGGHITQLCHVDTVAKTVGCPGF